MPHVISSQVHFGEAARLVNHLPRRSHSPRLCSSVCLLARQIRAHFGKRKVKVGKILAAYNGPHIFADKKVYNKKLPKYLQQIGSLRPPSSRNQLRHHGAKRPLSLDRPYARRTRPQRESGGAQGSSRGNRRMYRRL